MTQEQEQDIQEQDIRSLLQAKTRAKVNPRNASLKSEQSSSPLAKNEEEDSPPEKDGNSLNEELIGANDQKQQLQKELDNLPQVGKRLAIHLEQDVRTNLLQLCNEQEITPETFFEAAYILLQEKPKLLGQVVSNAKDRLQVRKRAGLVRRTLSIMDKLSNQKKKRS